MRIINSSIYIVIVVGSLLMASCGQSNTTNQVDGGKQATDIVENQNSRLANIRAEMTKEYEENKQQLQTRNERPCEEYFKVIHQIDKSEFSLNDVTNFIQLDLSKCPNNVELSQSYNERLFRLAEKRPDLFVQATEKVSIASNKELIKHWNAPIHDGVDDAKIKAKVIQTFQKEMRRLSQDDKSVRRVAMLKDNLGVLGG